MQIPDQSHDEEISEYCRRGTPQFSPDDQSILFASPLTGNGDIYSARLDGSRCTQLTRSEELELKPAYSPRGDRIAYLRSFPDHRGFKQIWLMDADGNNQRAVTQGEVFDDDPRFSEDSRRILFTRSTRIAPNTLDVVPMAVNVDGTGLQRREEEPLDRSRIYSSDQHMMVDIESEPGARERSLPNLWLRAGRDGERRFLAKGINPFFSKDGTRVFFHTDIFQSAPLAVINVDGTGQKTLDLPWGYKSPTCLSHDGKLLAVSNYAEASVRGRIVFAIHVVDLADYSVRRLACGSVSNMSKRP